MKPGQSREEALELATAERMAKLPGERIGRALWIIPSDGTRPGPGERDAQPLPEAAGL